MLPSTSTSTCPDELVDRLRWRSRDNQVDVWLLCWTPENDTGFHDHDASSGGGGGGER